MKKLILVPLLILGNTIASFSQERITEIDDNFYSFLCKHIYEREKSKDSVVFDLNSPLKRVGYFCYLSQQFYLGSFDKFETYLGITPSNSLKILKKYLNGNAQQKETLKNKKIISEFNRSSKSIKDNYKILVKIDCEDFYSKIRTSFIKCPISKCLETNLNIYLKDFEIHKYPYDTSEIIFNTQGLVKAQQTNSSEIQFDTAAFVDSTLATVDTSYVSDTTAVGISIMGANLVSIVPVNNYFNVRFKSENDSVIGWVCACAITPIPYLNSSWNGSQLQYLKTELANLKWYRDCFEFAYNEDEHLKILVRLSNYSPNKEKIPILEEALLLEKNKHEILAMLGDAYKGLEDYTKAVKLYTQSIEINNNLPCVYAERGRTKLALGDARGAIMDFDKSISLKHSDISLYIDRGNVRFDLRHYQDAIKDYTTIISYKETHYNYWCYVTSGATFINLTTELKELAYLNRGLAKINLSQTNAGCLDLSKAGELGQEGAYEAIKKYCND